MRELKPLSGLAPEEHDLFWRAWAAIATRRRAEIARAMAELAEDNVELDFNAPLIWMLDDEDAPAHAPSFWRSTRTGTVTVNVEPAPSSESTAMWPPCSSTMRRAMERPRPVPPFLRVSEPSAC